MRIFDQEDSASPSLGLDGLAARFGQAIAHAGLNQSEFARRLGVSPGFVSDVVRGQKKPGAEFLHAVRVTFGVSIDWLLTGEGTLSNGSRTNKSTRVPSTKLPDAIFMNDDRTCSVHPTHRNNPQTNNGHQAEEHAPMNTEQPSPDESSHSQIIQGRQQRTAGRDYYEHSALSSVKTLLTCESKAELDRIALDNYRMFKYRFGFEPPTHIRKQVIAIQRQYDFTDNQIRWFRHSGMLRITTEEAKLMPSRLMFMAGWMQLLLVSLVCSSMLFQISYPTAIVPAWKQMAGYLLICGYWAVMAWPLCKLYLESWYVLKRAGALAS